MFEKFIPSKRREQADANIEIAALEYELLGRRHTPEGDLIEELIRRL
ncbi:MAG: hypothetical protein AAB672_02630 [Patescibacteria group bacterium]